MGPNPAADQPGPVRVFVSYAYDDEPHKQQVRDLAQRLREHGIDVRLDHWDLTEGDIPAFMSSAIRNADRILICASPKYRNDVHGMEEGGPATGCALEHRQITGEIFTNQKSFQQLHVVILKGTPESSLSSFLAGTKYIDLTKDFEGGYFELVRRLTGQVPTALPLQGSRTPGYELTRPNPLRLMLDIACPQLHSWLCRSNVLAFPPEYQALSDYLSDRRGSLIQEISQKTYIESTAREVPRSGPADQSLEARDSFTLPVQRVIRYVLGEAQGGDAASAQIAAVSRRTRVVRNLLKTLRRTSEPLMLLGDPGTGKTLTLQQAALAAVNSDLQRVYPSVAIYVRVSDFHVASGEVKAADVAAFVRSSVPNSLRPYVEPLDADGRLLVFFDGLDEMSRQRYNEHTAALSEFAARGVGARIRTLFSCRITDFSPLFIHQRLVLLPFDERQVREYLKRAFPGVRTLVIDGRKWTLGDVCQHICASGFPIDASNPFALYLICSYIDAQKQWPRSRTEMLAAFLRDTYNRKCRNATSAFLPLDEALRAWAELAYSITDRNLGGSLSVAEIPTLTGWDGETVQDVIRVGRRCGVLEESVDRTVPQIRFEHHRLQEYLTARYIDEKKPGIEWLDKIDAPRWQETLVNLAVMGGGQDAIDALAKAIDEPVARARGGNLEFLRERRGLRNRDQPGVRQFLRELMDDWPETDVADRTELAARIIRDVSRDSYASTRLLPVVRRAVKLLTEYGNPVTQLKMIRVAILIPEPQLVQWARRPLSSGVSWVRNQAFILLSHIGSDLPMNMAEDLADGELLSRVPQYRKALKNSRKARWTRCFRVGVACAAAEWCLNLTTAAWLYYASLRFLAGTGVVIPHRLELPRGINEPPPAVDPIALLPPQWMNEFASVLLGEPMLAVAVAGIAATGAFVIRKSPDFAGASMLLAACMLVFVPFVLLATWHVPASAGWVAWGPALFVIAGPWAAGSIWLGAVRGVTLSGFLTLTAPWELNDVRQLWRRALRANGLPPGRFLRWSLVPPLLWALFWFGGFRGVLLVVLACMASLVRAAFLLSRALLRGAVRAVRAVAGRKGSDGLVLQSRSKWLTPEHGAAAGLLVAVTALFVGLFKLLEPHSMITAKFAVLAAVLGLGFLLAKLLVRLWRWFRDLGARPLPPASYTPQQWLDLLRDSPADEQHRILARTSHQSLSRTAAEFLEVLRKAEPVVKGERPISTYWRMRAELEEVLRQERRG